MGFERFELGFEMGSNGLNWVRDGFERFQLGLNLVLVLVLVLV